jgi:hypothetical protein
MGWQGEVLIDYSLNPAGSTYHVLFSNKNNAARSVTVAEKSSNSVEIGDLEGKITYGPTRVLRVQLQPMEVQILTKSPIT